MKDIILTGSWALGTIDVMEWILAQGSCVSRQHYRFISDKGELVGICSLHKENATLEDVLWDVLLLYDTDKIPAFEYKGMRRYKAEAIPLWYFEIDNNIYVFTL